MPKKHSRQMLEQAAHKLAEGLTVEAAASELGIHRNTVRKWASRPEFLDAFERETMRLQREIHAGVLVRARSALDTLDGLLSDEDKRIRLGAAKTLITAVQTTRPESMGAALGNAAQTVIVIGTAEGDAAIAEARARVMEARAAAVLPEEVKSE